MAHLLDTTIFATLHDGAVVDWNLDGQVDLGDGTEQRFSWTAEGKPRLRRLLDDLSAEVSRLAIEEGRRADRGSGAGSSQEISQDTSSGQVMQPTTRDPQDR